MQIRTYGNDDRYGSQGLAQKFQRKRRDATGNLMTLFFSEQTLGTLLVDHAVEASETVTGDEK